MAAAVGWEGESDGGSGRVDAHGCGEETAWCAAHVEDGWVRRRRGDRKRAVSRGVHVVPDVLHHGVEEALALVVGVVSLVALLCEVHVAFRAGPSLKHVSIGLLGAVEGARTYLFT